MRSAVLIVGGGPVGSTLALDLAWRGIDVIVAEQNPRGQMPGVKCNHVAARTMEIFRRLGVAEIVRNKGLPADHANDVAFRTSAVGADFARIPIPCRRDRYTFKDGPDGHWPTPEPPHRINQIYLDPLLAEAAASRPKVRFLWQTRVLGFTPNRRGGRRRCRKSGDRGSLFHRLRIPDRLRRPVVDGPPGDRCPVDR